MRNIPWLFEQKPNRQQLPAYKNEKDQIKNEVKRVDTTLLLMWVYGNLPDDQGQLNNLEIRIQIC